MVALVEDSRVSWRRQHHQANKRRILEQIKQRGGEVKSLCIQDLRTKLGMGDVSMTPFKRAVNSLYYGDSAIRMERKLVESDESVRRRERDPDAQVDTVWTLFVTALR